MALFNLNLTHEDAIKSHQSFYSDTFEVLPMRRRGYFDIFPLNVLIAYAGVNGGGEWDGIISTDGKKIVITESKWANQAKHKKVFECNLDEVESMTHTGSRLSILFQNSIKGLTMAKGNYFLKYLIFFCTLSLAFVFASYFFKGNLLNVQLKNDFKNKEKFTSLLKNIE